MSDLLVGLPVALLALPQAMAYALVAGLPISCGIFSAVFGAVIASGFGHSRWLVLGPTNTAAILLQSATSEVMFSYYWDIDPAAYPFVTMQVMAQITLIVGSLQVLAAILQLGRLTEFVSHSVVAGYLAAAALTLGVSQLFPFLGIDRLEGYHPVLYKMYYVLTHLHETHLATFVFASACLGLLILLRRLPKRLPTAAIMLLVATGVTYAVAVYRAGGIPDAGPIASPIALLDSYGGVDRLIPTLSVPLLDLRVLNAVFPGAVALALLGVLETSSVAKSVSIESPDTDRNILGLGVANVASAFIGAMPTSVSPSRTALNIASGARTRIAAMSSGVWVLVLVALFGWLIRFTPLPAMAALLLLMAATRIIDWDQFKACFYATTTDRVTLLATLLTALFLSLHIAFFIGVVVSVTLYLREAARPRVAEQRWEREGDSDKQIRVINVEGELFFGATERLESKLHPLTASNKADVVVLHLRNAYHLDATACLMLERLRARLKRQGQHVLLAGINARAWKVLRKAGTAERWGEGDCFPLDEGRPVDSVLRALERARGLMSEGVGQS